MDNSLPPLFIDDFNYHLPEEQIAYHPLQERSDSKMLFYQNGTIADKHFYEIPDLLDEQHMLFFNNTKVVRARLIFFNEHGAKIEVFCLEPFEQSIEMAMASKHTTTWNCLIGNVKKWTASAQLKISFNHFANAITLTAALIQRNSSDFTVQFSWNFDDLSFSEILNNLGKIPLPPYIKRENEINDTNRYQTCYAQIEGSVAAPTAGLHFSDEILAKLKSKKIAQHALTLHVGAGTFMPVKTANINEHEMHAEHFIVTLEVLRALRDALRSKKQIIAVGTTSCRTLESLFWIGEKINQNPQIAMDDFYVHQWVAYQQNQASISSNQAINCIINYCERNLLNEITGRTSIIIVPGYRFNIIHGLITNFHQPKSTLMLLVAAFVGDNWRNIYAHALHNNYRFLSYGDTSLLIP